MQIVLFSAPLNLFWTWSGHCFVKKFVAKKSLKRELENNKTIKLRNVTTVPNTNAKALQRHNCTSFYVDVSKLR